jgi:hypothetical protein
MRTWQQLIFPPRKPKGDPRNFQRMRVTWIHAHQQAARLRSERWQRKHQAQGCEMCSIRLKYREAT